MEHKDDDEEDDDQSNPDQHHDPPHVSDPLYDLLEFRGVEDEVG